MYRYKLMFKLPQLKAWLTQEITRAKITYNLDKV